jgi:hypothetical protein
MGVRYGLAVGPGTSGTVQEPFLGSVCLVAWLELWWEH